MTGLGYNPETLTRVGASQRAFAALSHFTGLQNASAAAGGYQSAFLFPWQPVSGQRVTGVVTRRTESHIPSSMWPISGAYSIVHPIYNAAAMDTARACPGQGGGVLGLVVGFVFSTVIMGPIDMALPAKLHKYAAIIVILVISYFTAGALTAALVAVLPELAFVAAGAGVSTVLVSAGYAAADTALSELASNVVGKVLTPANLMQFQMPRPSVKDLASFKSSMAAMWAGVEQNPIEQMAGAYADGLITVAQTGNHAPLLAAAQDLMRLQTIIATVLSIAWMQDLDGLFATSDYYAGLCGLNAGTGWNTDQWFNWSMTLGPGSVPPLPTVQPAYVSVTQVHEKSGEHSWRTFNATKIIPAPISTASIANYNPLLVQNSPDAPRLALLAAFARAQAPAWVGPWLWDAMVSADLLTAAKTQPIAKIIPAAFHHEFQTTLSAVAAARSAAKIAAAKTIAEQKVAVSMAHVSHVATTALMQKETQYGPLLVGAAVAAKVLLGAGLL